MAATNEASVREPRSADTTPDERARQLAQIAQEVGDLPALPQVAMRALKIADQEEWSIVELESEILQDPALAARLLHLANSPHFGARRSVTTVKHALSLIGNKKVRSVLMAAAVEGLHESKRSNFPGKLLWEHALAVASISQHFATVCQSGDPEEAFMAGLLHDIGRPVMDSLFPDRYREVIDLVETGDAETYRGAELQVFGYDHTDVGFLVARGWDLPPLIAGVIRFHHDPNQASADRLLCATVSLANSACMKNEIGPEKHRELDLASLPSVQILGLDESKLEELMKTPFAETTRHLTV